MCPGSLDAANSGATGRACDTSVAIHRELRSCYLLSRYHKSFNRSGGSPVRVWPGALFYLEIGGWENMATATEQKSISLIDVIKAVDETAAQVDRTLVCIAGLNFEVQVYHGTLQLLWSRLERDNVVIRAGYARDGQSEPANSVHFSYMTLVFNREGAFRYAVDF